VATVEVTRERELAHPLEACYDWLTTDVGSDPARAGTVIEARDVVTEDEQAGQTELAERISALGFQRQVRTIVDLDPPDTWRARVFESTDDAPDVFTYELEPVTEDRTRLRATYRFERLDGLETLLVRLLSPVVRRRLDRMWDGFEQAMDRELDREHVV